MVLVNKTSGFCLGHVDWPALPKLPSAGVLCHPRLREKENHGGKLWLQWDPQGNSCYLQVSTGLSVEFFFFNQTYFQGGLFGVFCKLFRFKCHCFVCYHSTSMNYQWSWTLKKSFTNQRLFVCRSEVVRYSMFNDCYLFIRSIKSITCRFIITYWLYIIYILFFHILSGFALFSKWDPGIQHRKQISQIRREGVWNSWFPSVPQTHTKTGGLL